ncbi:SDR family NAD(P)-dependent oxidoreductase [Inquilinus sp. OTU3971]|uniref:SDR family NAD(P)-dependent oxidoreductase n=1 Tax=Inquilinus sp. OTU3971 TaxID=3043855 RepID=UPI00313AE3D8
MTFRFDDRVAIVTGSGSGLGRAHALGLAAAGARVVVNDAGGPDAAQRVEAVVAEIRTGGGEAIGFVADVRSPAEMFAMREAALAAWNRIDILVNNAGMLRDRTFPRLDLDDFRAVLEVHLLGAANATRAVWDVFRERQYGRLVVTTSSSGLYGNFGQTNYAAAKAGLVGFMNVLHHEGARHGIRVNALAPAAATRMTQGLLKDADLALLDPHAVTPGLLFLVGDTAPSRTILSAGAGSFAVVKILETRGIYLPEDQRTPEAIAARLDEIMSLEGARELTGVLPQFEKLLGPAKATDTPLTAE